MQQPNVLTSDLDPGLTTSWSPSRRGVHWLLRASIFALGFSLGFAAVMLR